MLKIFELAYFCPKLIKTVVKLSKSNKYEVFESGGPALSKKFLTSKKEKKNLQNNEILIPKGGGVVLYANCVGFEYKCVEHYLKQA